jgi:hypothetical protein
MVVLPDAGVSAGGAIVIPCRSSQPRASRGSLLESLGVGVGLREPTWTASRPGSSPGRSKLTTATAQAHADVASAYGDAAGRTLILQAGTTLDTADGSHVNLTGDAQACNVFWEVGSSATLGEPDGRWFGGRRGHRSVADAEPAERERAVGQPC